MSTQQIAHYRVIRKIGEGGMGAVYCATDTKLNREVAIKVLPDAFAGDADRMSRFTREAQVLASLNHPNIATIPWCRRACSDHGAGRRPYAGRPDRSGPIPLDEALPIAQHRRGIRVRAREGYHSS